MPTLDVKSKKPITTNVMEQMIEILSKELAPQLSCPGNILSKDDFSIRFQTVRGKMSDVEILIFADDNPTRAERHDQIASEVRDALSKEFPRLGKITVSLLLVRYGYSFG